MRHQANQHKTAIKKILLETTEDQRKNYRTAFDVVKQSVLYNLSTISIISFRSRIKISTSDVVCKFILEN